MLFRKKTNESLPPYDEDELPELHTHERITLAKLIERNVMLWLRKMLRSRQRFNAFIKQFLSKFLEDEYNKMYIALLA